MTAAVAATHDVHVGVRPQYLPGQSVPHARRYVFAYTIRIENRTSETVQLLRRHWRIMHGNGKTQEVHGDGVVGEQPVLEPGEHYEYTSGCVLTTPHGTMEGEYEMRDTQDRMFRVSIPPFTLAAPFALN